MAIEWGLAQQPNAFQNAFAMGQQIGGQIKQQRAENALSAYIGSKAGTGGIVATPEQQAQSDQLRSNLIRANPMMAMRVRQMEQEEEARAAQGMRAEQDRAAGQLPVLGRLLDYASKGPEQWQQALDAAQRYGIDVSSVPGQFDPQWAQQQAQMLKDMQTPQGQEAVSGAGKQAQDMGYRPGTPEYAAAVRELVVADLSKPYTGAQGETRLYTPQLGQQGRPQATGGPQPGTVEDGYRFKGGNPADPNSWEQVGGPTQPASGGFRP